MPDKLPFVSVIIPAYNAEGTIRRCVESVLRQTFTDIEVIVVDDGSCDGTLAVLRQMQIENARLVVRHQENAGVSAARNVGLALAKGEWVAFVDSDDYVTETYIATLLPQTDGIDFTICSLADVDAGGCEFPRQILPGFPADDLRSHTMNIGEALSAIPTYLLCGPYCKLFRHNVIVNFGVCFPDKVNFGEDAIFVFAYLQYVERIQATDSVAYYYTHPQGESPIRFSIQWYDMCVRIKGYMSSICDRHNVQNRQRIEAHVLDRLTTALSLNAHDHLMTKAQRYASYNMIADFVAPHIYRPHMPFFFPFFALLRWWRGYEWLFRKIYK